MSSPKEMLCMWKAVEVLCKSKDIGFSLLNPQSHWPFKLKLLQEGGSWYLLLTLTKLYCVCILLFP